MAMAARTAISISAAALLAFPALAGAPGGLDWGASPDAVSAVFPDVAPISQSDAHVSLPLPAIAARVKAQGGFCPTMICASKLGEGGAATFSFAEAGLSEIYIAYTRSFADLVADVSLLTQIQRDRVARSEFQVMSAEFASRYGAPAIISDVERQYDDVIVVGGATYLAEDGGAVSISVGRRGKSLVGDIWYLPPGAEGGF